MADLESEYVALRRSNPLLVQVNQFEHIDPKGVGNINEFGKVETVLTGFVVEDERLGLAETFCQLCSCEVVT